MILNNISNLYNENVLDIYYSDCAFNEFHAVWKFLQNKVNESSDFSFGIVKLLCMTKNK